MPSLPTNINKEPPQNNKERRNQSTDNGLSLVFSKRCSKQYTSSNAHALQDHKPHGLPINTTPAPDPLQSISIEIRLRQVTAKRGPKENNDQIMKNETQPHKLEETKLHIQQAKDTLKKPNSKIQKQNPTC